MSNIDGAPPSGSTPLPPNLPGLVNQETQAAAAAAPKRPAGPDPFAEFDPDLSGPPQPNAGRTVAELGGTQPGNLPPSLAALTAEEAPQKPPGTDPFAEFDPDLQPRSGVVGSLVRGAEGAVIPAAAGMAAAGPAAEAGAIAGGGIGALFGGVGAVPGAAVGGLVGGLAGFIGGSYVGQTAQDWALKALPDSWKDELGQDEKQLQLDQEKHPIASFIGGLAPYALTSWPSGLSKLATKLPDNAPVYQRLMANPITAHLFGGVAMGGMEFGQELANHQAPDWTKVAISTGFGTVFNRPNRLGMGISELGARPVRAGVTAVGARMITPDLRIPVGAPLEPPPNHHEIINAQRAVVTDPTSPDHDKPASVIYPSARATVVRFDDGHLGVFSNQDLRPDAPLLAPGQDAVINDPGNATLGPGPQNGTAVTILRPSPDHTGYVVRYPGGEEGFVGVNLLKPFKAEGEPTIAEADNLGVLGPGNTEEVYNGTEERSPEAAAASRATLDAENQALGKVEPENIHGLAERVDPDAFHAFDAVNAQYNEIQGHIFNLTEDTTADHSAEVAQLETQLKALDDQRAELSPRVRAAYAHAAAYSEAATPRPPQEAAKPSERPAEPPGATPGTLAPVVPAGVAADKAHIATQFHDQLIAAGRPEDEASAVADLAASRYAARAAALGNKVSPRQLYDEDAPAVQPAKSRARRGKAVKGVVKVTPGERSVIGLTKEADASTAIHELGHAWLGETMKDATRPEATPELAADAKTIRDYLNMKDGQQEPTTQQHEKFARAFEHYLREGVAPASRRLEGVFEKFKGWLTEIYDTLKGRGAALNDNIRRVFDRLVEAPVVHAPERDLPQSLAAIHEAEAREVHPAEAEPAMDRVLAEAEHELTDRPQEILDEYRQSTTRNEPGGETDLRPGVTGEVGEDRNGPEFEPTGIGGSGGAGAELRGGGAAGTEGAGLPEGTTGAGSAAGSTDAGPRAERPQPGGAARVNPLASEPAPFIERRRTTPTLDKAGNIRLDKIESPEAVKQFLRDESAANGDFMNERQELTQADINGLATDMGMEPGKLSIDELKNFFVNGAAEILAARKLLKVSATNAVEAARAATLSRNPEDIIKYATAKEQNMMIQGQVARITAEWGRAGTAFKMLIGGERQSLDVSQFLKRATGRTLFQLQQEAALLSKYESPAEANKFMRDSRHKAFGRMALEFWVNGLIAGLQTHVTYAVGNTLLALERASLDTAAASAVGAVRHAITGTEDYVRPGEVGARFRGLHRGIPIAVKAAIDAIKAGRTALLPGEEDRMLAGSKLNMLQSEKGSGQGTEAPRINETVQWHHAIGGSFAMIRGLRTAFLAMGPLLTDNEYPLLNLRFSPLGYIPDVRVHGLAVLPFGTAVRLPSRGVAGIHTFFRVSNMMMERHARAYRTAVQEGLSGNAFDARIADKIANPTEEEMKEDRDIANEMTMMGQSSVFINKLSELTNTEFLGFPWFKFVDPFVRVGGSVMDVALNRHTPLGLLSKDIRNTVMGKDGGVAQDMAIGRMLVGTSLAITVGGLAAEGLASGSGPSDPAKNAMWRLAGNQPHSVRIGDWWISTERLGPLGLLMSISADLYDVAHAAAEGHMLNAALAAIKGFSTTILDESFMTGPADLLRAIEDPERYGSGYIRNQLATWIPFYSTLSQTNRAIDPFMRDAKSISDALKSHVPGLSETLMPRVDIWGNPIPNPQSVLPGVLAIYMKNVHTDPVNIALANLGMGPAALPRNFMGVTLSDQQYYDYARIAGQLAKSRMDAVVRSPYWARMSPPVQREVVTATIKFARESARGMMKGKYPSLINQAYKNKITKFNTVTPLDEQP